MTDITPYEDGKLAFKNKRALLDNPYAKYTHEWQRWDDGFRDAHWGVQ